MPQLRCPKCATLVMAEPGQNVRCPNCGFQARGPPAEPPRAKPAPTNARVHHGSTPPPPTGHAAAQGEPLRALSVWAFLIAFIALGTFYFARYGVPFVLGATASVMGVVSFAK